MVGQSKLLKKLASYSLETLPHTLLFIGEAGSGKHTIINELAKHLSLTTVLIDNKINIDNLITYQQDAIPKLYIIDLAYFIEKQQNQLLKFIEEPSNTVYICLLATSEIGILPTILNRCIKYELLPYTLDELKQIHNFANNILYDIYKTPGQLLAIDEVKALNLYKFCNNIICNINKASFSNTLSLATKINFKEDYNKFDFYDFFTTMKFVSFSKYISKNDEFCLKIYLYTVKYYQQIINKIILKDAFMLEYLAGLWELFH